MTIKVELFFDLHSATEVDPVELEGLLFQLVARRLLNRERWSEGLRIKGDSKINLNHSCLTELTRELGDVSLRRLDSPIITGLSNRKGLLDRLR